MRRTPQLPYSPDLAPSDFYLFPPRKAKFEVTQVADEDQFVASLQAILRGIDRDELDGSFPRGRHEQPFLQNLKSREDKVLLKVLIKIKAYI
jgi:hypothetical protein